MTDYSRENQGVCRKHGGRVALDEGCARCDEEAELRYLSGPTCAFCYKRLTDDEALNNEYYCDKCEEVALGELDPEKNEP